MWGSEWGNTWLGWSSHSVTPLFKSLARPTHSLSHTHTTHSLTRLLLYLKGMFPYEESSDGVVAALIKGTIVVKPSVTSSDPRFAYLRCSMQFLRLPNGHRSPQISFPSAWLHVFEEPRSPPWDENLTPEGGLVNRERGDCHSTCLPFACLETDLGSSIFL